MTEERLRHTHGYRDRTRDTRLGSLQLRIPKLRQSSYFPPSRRVPHRNVSGRAVEASLQRPLPFLGPVGSLSG